MKHLCFGILDFIGVRVIEIVLRAVLIVCFDFRVGHIEVG